VLDLAHRHHLFVLEVEVDEMLTSRLYRPGMGQGEAWVLSLPLLDLAFLSLLVGTILLSLLVIVVVQGRLYLG
jgi:hypothetical protein